MVKSGKSSLGSDVSLGIGATDVRPNEGTGHGCAERIQRSAECVGGKAKGLLSLQNESKHSKGTFDASTEVAGRRGDGVGLRQAHQTDRRISKGRHHTRLVARAYVRAIFVIGHVAHVMKSVFNCPMTAVCFQDLLGARFIGQ